MQSSKPLIIPWLLLASFLYLICVILGDSILQGSLFGILLFIITFKYYFSDYKRLWNVTWKGWALVFSMALLSLVLTEAFTKSAKGAYDLMRASFLFFVAATVVVNIRGGAELRVARIFFVSATFAILLSYILLASMQGGLMLRDNPLITLYLSGIHEYANVISIVLLGFIGLCVVDRKSLSLLHFCCIGILLFVLIMSDSRGAYLALTLCALYLSCYLVASLRLLWWPAALFVLAAFLYISYFHVGTTFLGYDLPFSFLERIRLSKGTAEAIFEAPWFGYGLNTYKFISENIGFKNSFVMPHNIYLELIFSIGVVGVFILSLALAKLLVLQEEWRTLLIKSNDFWVLFSQLLLVYLAFRGLTELRLGFKTWGMLMICLGIMAGVQLRYDNAKRSES